jgi:hypothetical protein
MRVRGQRAFAYARVRAWRGRLLRRGDILHLLGREPPPAGDDSLAQLLEAYRLVIRSYPEQRECFRSLLRLHEVENIKLVWRAIVRGADRRRWSPLWLFLGDLATVELPSSITSLRDFVAGLAKTPYATIAQRVMLAHGTDLAAADLAFDRWAAADVLRASSPLAQLERRLLETVVRERDAQLSVRGATLYGWSEAAVRSTSLLGKGKGDILAIRRERLRLCRRAFAGDPFTLAPPIALILLFEEQVRGMTALLERRGDERLDDVAWRQLATSLMGAA